MLLHSNKKVILNNANRHRRLNNILAANAADRTDAKLSDRIAIFQDQIKNKFLDRIPLKLSCNIGKVNQYIKLKTKFTLMLETEMKNLFGTNANNAANLDAEIIFTDAPFIQYQQIKLDNNFRTYLESSLLLENNLRTRIQNIAYQKSYEIDTGSQFRVVDSRGNNKQSDQHTSVYVNYNLEPATRKIKSIELLLI